MDASAWWWVVALSLGLLGSIANGFAATRQVWGTQWKNTAEAAREATFWSRVGWPLIALGYGAGIVAAVLGGLLE
jgi:hypothetical protein